MNLELSSPPDPFGASLAPALLDACAGRLSSVRWFRTDWQRGGALTGYASWDDGAGGVPVVVKLPVPPQELLWLERLQGDRNGCGQAVPRLYGSGREVGGYDFAWAVMQRMRYGPLDASWSGAEVQILLDAAATFYGVARRYPVDAPPRDEAWDQTVKRSRDAVQNLNVPEPQRWAGCLRTLQKKLDKVLTFWNARPVEDWCHGDFHLGNAMTDAPPPAGPAVLFDLAMVHAGHWVEDAIYFESLFWPHPQRLGGVDIPKSLAAARKARGLRSDPHWPRLAQTRRVLLAAATPAQQTMRPDPARLHAALAVLEQTPPHF